MMYIKGKLCSYFFRENVSKFNYYENKYGFLGEKIVKLDFYMFYFQSKSVWLDKREKEVDGL